MNQSPNKRRWPLAYPSNLSTGKQAIVRGLLEVFTFYCGKVSKYNYSQLHEKCFMQICVDLCAVRKMTLTPTQWSSVEALYYSKTRKVHMDFHCFLDLLPTLSLALYRRPDATALLLADAQVLTRSVRTHLAHIGVKHPTVTHSTALFMHKLRDSLFRLYKLYFADSQGLDHTPHKSFHKYLQMMKDFNVCPKLVSSSVLFSIYNTVCDPEIVQDRNNQNEQQSKQATSRGKNNQKVQQGRQGSKSPDNSMRKNKTPNNSERMAKTFHNSERESKNLFRQQQQTNRSNLLKNKNAGRTPLNMKLARRTSEGYTPQKVVNFQRSPKDFIKIQETKRLSTRNNKVCVDQTQKFKHKQLQIVENTSINQQNNVEGINQQYKHDILFYKSFPNLGSYFTLHRFIESLVPLSQVCYLKIKQESQSSKERNQKDTLKLLMQYFQTVRTMRNFRFSNQRLCFLVLDEYANDPFFLQLVNKQNQDPIISPFFQELQRLSL